MAFSRRDFLKRTCCTAAAGMAAASFNRFGLVNALAQSAQDYKALVCVFMFGGNDSNNMVVPLSSSGYSAYQQTRSVLALPQGSLLPIAPPSAGAFGFHPMFKEMQPLFNQKHLAVLANVGTLVAPTTRAQFQKGQTSLPQNLFSHEDQQAQMQTAALDGNGQTGWAGRTADKIQTIYGGTFPVIISLAGTNIFCEGLSARSIESSGDPTKLLSGFSSSAESQSRLSALQSLLTFDTGVSLIQAASTTTSNALQDSNALANALASAPALVTAFPGNNGLASQLKQVAQIISVRSALGLQRQIFFVSIGGFDTHSDQLNAQNSLYTQVSQAMNAFYQATVEIGAAADVTTFSLSDFSRTYVPDSTSGTDHAWGSHHLIMGGAVHGGDFYGTFPNLTPGGPDDATNQGRWIPTTSLDQYAGTLANWFGVPTADLPTIFPNLPNFSNQLLNFVG